jgi:hypothetical protein
MWHVFDFSTLWSCHTLLSIWPTCYRVHFLPTFTTLSSFLNSSHTFMAAIFADVRFGKIWLATKHAPLVWLGCCLFHSRGSRTNRSLSRGRNYPQASLTESTFSTWPYRPRHAKVEHWRLWFLDPGTERNTKIINKLQSSFPEEKKNNQGPSMQYCIHGSKGISFPKTPEVLLVAWWMLMTTLALCVLGILSEFMRLWRISILECYFCITSW